MTTVAVGERIWVSYSQVATFRACPQKWNYSYKEHLDRLVDATPKVELELGSWWNAVLVADSLERGRNLRSLQAIPTVVGSIDDGPTFDPQTVTVEEVMDAALDWFSAQSVAVQEEWEGRVGQGLPRRLRSMFDRWRDEWAKERAGEEPLAVELGWQRDLPPLPDGTDSGARLVGYVDEVYRDKTRGLLVVRDHKSSKSLATQTTADDMMDSQLQFYAWGASPTIHSWGVGQVRATAYDRIRTMAAKTPAVTLGGSLSASITDFDRETYVEWAAGRDGNGVPWGVLDTYYVTGPRKGQPKFGTYTADPAVIERLSTPAARSVWFQRTLTPLNGNLIKAHLRAAVDSALDMQRAKERLERDGEAARNLTSGCRWCDFAGLCRAQMIGGPSGDYDLAAYGLRRTR